MMGGHQVGGPQPQSLVLHYMQRQRHGVQDSSKVADLMQDVVSSAVQGEVLVADLALCIYTCEHWIQVSISSSNARIYKITSLQAQQFAQRCLSGCQR